MRPGGARFGLSALVRGGGSWFVGVGADGREGRGRVGMACRRGAGASWQGQGGPVGAGVG